MTMQRPLAMARAFADLGDTSYILSPELRIVRVNAAWTRFAKANGGSEMLARWGRNSFVLEAISRDLRDFYRDLFERARTSARPIHHDYDCNTPTTPRAFRMVMFPLEGGFLAITHSPRIDSRMADDVYVHDGLLHICSFCERIRTPSSRESWDWVPGYVARTDTGANISHGLCAPCAKFCEGER